MTTTAAPAARTLAPTGRLASTAKHGWFCRGCPSQPGQRSGRIINISSDAGVIPFAEGSAYCAAKAAVIVFSRCLALEMLPHDVGVHVICPGYVDTPWYDGDSSAPDRGKMLKAGDIARLAVYLAALPPRVLIDQVVIRPRSMALE